MENNPELQARLAELDRELEEGEITSKGYQKRRTLLFDQFQGQNLNLGIANAGRTPSIISSQQSVPGRAGASSPAPFAPDSPSIGRRSLAPSNVDVSTNRRDTMLSSGSTMSYNSQQGPFRSFSQPAAAWHGRQGSYSSQANPSQNRQTSYSYNPQQSIQQQQPQHDHSRQYSQQSSKGASTDYDGSSSYDGYYNNNSQDVQTPQPGMYGYGDARSQTMAREPTYDSMSSVNGYFADFPTQSYEYPNRDSYYSNQQAPADRYQSNSDYPPYSPAAAYAPPLLTAADLPPTAITNFQLPLEPRQVPFDLYDPHNHNIQMSKFANIASVLRYRMTTNAKQPAFLVLDNKGKETATCTWEKMGARAEKVAQVIRDKSNLYKGDRVALIYRDVEVIDFAVAVLGCFIAGVVAVPINNPENHDRLNFILQQTQAHLALTTDNNLKAFQRDLTNHKLAWPRGVEWWKTNEFGSFHPKRKDELPALEVPDLAYIEFAEAPTGDLRGVVMDHRTIMHQMSCLSAIVKSATTHEGSKDTFSSTLRDKSGKPIVGHSSGDILVSYLDPRHSIGMIFSVLLGVYGGHTTIYFQQQCMSSPGMYAHIITKYRATLVVADYPGLKTVAYNYQSDPFQTRNYSKKHQVDFSQVKLCLIDCLTVDSEFHEILADRWLRPLGNTRARDVVAPMLCLPEHGGMVVASRDWLGGEERMGVPLVAEPLLKSETEKPKEVNTGGYSGLIGADLPRPDEMGQGKSSELLEVLVDKEALKTNEIILIAIGSEAKKRASEPGTVRLTAFGYPLADATLAVVDPENSVLCPPNVVGEIWVDSPSLSGGFWALPKHTDTIFHARPYKFENGNPLPVMLDLEFLRTGLLGCIIEGKVFILGLYEDRLRQKVEWSEGSTDMEVSRSAAEYRYFYIQHLIVTVIKNVPKIYDSSAFDVFVNDEHLPVILLESSAASTSPTSAGGPPRVLDVALLDSISEKTMEVLLEEHQIRVYCVMIMPPNTLPRTWKNGRREIRNMLCRKEFDVGALPCVHVKFGVERAVLNLPVGVDPVGGIWSPIASMSRQEYLGQNERQYSGFDHHEVIIDDKTNMYLNNFSSIVDCFQWRVARQDSELSYCSVDGRGKEGKHIGWKKLDLKIAAVAMYLKRKGLKAGDHVILMYPHCEEFVFAIHACFCSGIVAIPLGPLDQNRLNEDVPALLSIVRDYKVRAIIVNNDVDHLIKQKPISQHIKQSAAVLKIAMPPIHNTTKPTKQSSGCRDLGFTVQSAWVQPEFTAMVWIYWTPDQRRIAVKIGHDTIMGMCKVQKETCQMTSSRPVLACVRSTSGIGFVHTCLIGIFVGATTYLISPVDYGANPSILYNSLSKYKVKDTYATPQMLDHAIMNGAKGFNMNDLKNIMITFENRPRCDLFNKVRNQFTNAFLDRTAINTIYAHVLNPMITSRSYMCIEPVEMWLDTKSLRRGHIYPTDLDTDPSALLIQDSGMVPVSTQIAIVNPESCMLCHVGEYGEIWVDSEACAKAFYGSTDPFDAERFHGRTVDGDPRIEYVRTGDLGFLHTISRPIGVGGAEVEMQVLFVLGAIGETFEVNGLTHFPIDIETSVEQCHRNIVPGGSAVFQAGGLVVILVEVIRKSFLAAIVPVIVNAILDEHQLVVDIVSFVGKGDFPRSRLGEKQRGKILASWVTRKLRTVAQFGIRNFDKEFDQSMLLHPSMLGSVPPSIIEGGNMIDSPLANSYHNSPEADEKVNPMLHLDTKGATLAGAATHDYASFPNYEELPATFSPIELPTSYHDDMTEHSKSSHTASTLVGANQNHEGDVNNNISNMINSLGLDATSPTSTTSEDTPTNTISLNNTIHTARLPASTDAAPEVPPMSPRRRSYRMDFNPLTFDSSEAPSLPSQFPPVLQESLHERSVSQEMRQQAQSYARAGPSNGQSSDIARPGHAKDEKRGSEASDYDFGSLPKEALMYSRQIEKDAH